MTLKPVIENYLLICQIEGLPISAVLMYRQVLSDFLEVVGDMEISVFQPTHVKRYIASLGGYRSKHANSIMRMFCKWLITQKDMRYVPTQPRRPSQIFQVTSKIKRSWVV